MIVKERDAMPRTIEALERRAGGTGDALLRTACLGAAARLRADRPTAGACELIDRNFAECDDWAVIHDLRLEIDGHAARFDHVLVGEALDVVGVDTRFVDAGLYLSGNGRCETFDGQTRRLVACPLAKMARDLRKLDVALGRVGLPRGRFGLRARPELAGCVLFDPAHRLGAPAVEPGGTVGVYPREALYRMLWKRRRRRVGAPRQRLSGEALRELAARLVDQHRPAFPPSLLEGKVEEETLRALAAARAAA